MILGFMGFIFGKIKEGLELDPRLVWLFRTFFLFFTGTGICGIFVNLFLLRTSNNNVELILKNNLFIYISMGTAFFVMGWVSKKLSSKLSMLVGISSYIAALVLLLLLQNEAPKFAIILGCLQGIGIGGYCVGNNVLFFDYTSQNNRTYVFTQQHIVLTTATFATPLIASLVISCFKDLTGYIIVFGLALISLATAAFMIMSIKDDKTKSQYKIFQLIAEMKVNSKWRNTMLGEIMRGIRDGFIFFNAILIFMISKQEMYVGITSFLTYAATVLFGILLGRKIKEKNRMTYLKIAVLVAILTSAVLIINPNVITIIIYAILSSFATIIINAISSTVIYNNIEKLENCQDLRIESIVLRDMVLNSGRSIGIIIAFFLPQQVIYYVWLMLFISITQVFMYLFFNKANQITGGLQNGNKDNYRCPMGR